MEAKDNGRPPCSNPCPVPSIPSLPSCPPGPGLYQTARPDRRDAGYSQCHSLTDQPTRTVHVRTRYLIASASTPCGIDPTKQLETRHTAVHVGIHVLVGQCTPRPTLGLALPTLRLIPIADPTRRSIAEAQEICSDLPKPTHATSSYPIRYATSSAWRSAKPSPVRRSRQAPAWT